MKKAPHILYIEDNLFNQRLIKKILTPEGFEISEAHDGIQGIKKAKELTPDLILMDLELPHLDGIGATTKIRSLPKMKHVPIVVLTSKNTKKERDRAFVAGCDGYIEKPIRAHNFADQIRKYLEGKHEKFDPTNKTRILKDFSVGLIDQLQAKIEELEQTNQALQLNKEELLLAYEQSKDMNREQEQLAQLKENIVAITSHELRTPLSLATGYIDLLLSGMLGEPDPEQERVLDISKDSLVKMRNLIDKITDLNRLDLKKLPMDLVPTHLNEAWSAALADMTIFIKIRKLHLEEALAASLSNVLADPGFMFQVFSNLLRNAICFTPDGGTIRVRTWEDQAKVYFQIQDSGIGLKEEDLERIFEEFYQVTDVKHHKTGQFEFMTRGVGVGLAMCRRIIAEHGGKIWAESAGLNHGSTFTFYLPGAPLA